MTRWIRAAVPAGAVDPLAWLAASEAAERFFWSRGDHAIAATGALVAIECRGERRFDDAVRAVNRLTPELGPSPVAEAAAPLPSLVGGFAFAAEADLDPAWAHLPPVRLWLPARMLVRRGGASWLAGAAPGEPGVDARAAQSRLRARLAVESSTLPAAPPRGDADTATPAYRVSADRSPAAFRALVAAARDAVVAGRFEKLVVARSLRIEANAPIDALALASVLRAMHPSCTTFLVERAGCSFLGATPERLVRLAGSRIATVALAGTAPRGRTIEEDRRLATALRESKKEQEEHAIVVRAIRAALEPVCATLACPEAPSLLRVDGIQHLATPIEGVLRHPAHALELVARLHPTPAVAGAPREAALAWLAAHESLARGWYAGGVGWLDAAGGGDFAVALRCARIEAAQAQLFAGAGVVAASQPQAELLETRLKLRTLLAPLLEP